MSVGRDRAPRSASIRFRPGTTPSRRSCWPYRRRARSSAPRSATTSTCATSKAAARCCSARPRTTMRPARSARSSACSTRRFSSTTCGEAELALTVEGDDGFRAERRSSHGQDQPRPAGPRRQTIGKNHQYPDGLVLFLGTMFAPTEDRDAPGRASPTRSATSSGSRRPLGALVNRVTTSDKAPPWTFGVRALVQNLASRGLLRRIARGSPLRFTGPATGRGSLPRRMSSPERMPDRDFSNSRETRS